MKRKDMTWHSETTRDYPGRRESGDDYGSWQHGGQQGGFGGNGGNGGGGQRSDGVASATIAVQASTTSAPIEAGRWVATTLAAATS
jgi:hypothetical protein